jgi:predicted ATPase
LKLDKLTVEGFRNLNNHVDFDEQSLSTVLVGKNGTGKSNLLEAIALIFKNLDLQCDPPFKYSLQYQIRKDKWIRIDADPQRDREKTRVFVTDKTVSKEEEQKPFSSLIKNSKQFLPNNVFGYYSGEISRFSDIFRKHREDYIKRVRKESGLPLPSLYLVEPYQSQFVLLSLFVSGDDSSLSFLRERFGIIGIESIEFKLHQPSWIKGKKTSGGNFWGAQGVACEFLTDLLKICKWDEEQLKLSVIDVKYLHDLFFKEKELTRIMFFKMLEIIYISDLLTNINISLKKEGCEDRVYFDCLSEGEQQVLLLIGLLKLMDEKESLFLLDEPETHLNPDWKYNFLTSLKEEFKEAEKSHIIIATHDPLLVGSLTKKQVQIFSYKGDKLSVEPPLDDPIGLGVDGILTSDLFGLRTTLDQSTQRDLDRRTKLIIKKNLGKETLTLGEIKELEDLDNSLAKLGFIGSTRDPLYTKFLVELTKSEEEEKVDFEKLDRGEQVKLVKKAIAEVEARRAKHEIS